MDRKVVIAGATGNLGERIKDHLVSLGAEVHVLTRGKNEVSGDSKGVFFHNVDYSNATSLAEACKGATCVVSAISGLREAMIDSQSRLLEAALKAGVPKFIPSDYCIDYRPLKHGTNRNLDLRREFSTILDSSGIKATSILNGMFTDLLKGDAPVILEKQKRIFFWGNADQKMDFTSVDNTAEVTANAALDESSPRWLSIAAEQASMRDMARIAERVYGGRFKFLRPGGLKTFQLMIKVTKTFAPGGNEVFPAWQGMQYLHDMLSGTPKHKQLDNNRYPDMRWDSIETILKKSEP